jgi:hypothetical protein
LVEPRLLLVVERGAERLQLGLDDVERFQRGIDALLRRLEPRRGRGGDVLGAIGGQFLRRLLGRVAQAFECLALGLVGADGAHDRIERPILELDALRGAAAHELLDRGAERAVAAAGEFSARGPRGLPPRRDRNTGGAPRGRVATRHSARGANLRGCAANRRSRAGAATRRGRAHAGARSESSDPASGPVREPGRGFAAGAPAAIPGSAAKRFKSEVLPGFRPSAARAGDHCWSQSPRHREISTKHRQRHWRR